MPFPLAIIVTSNFVSDSLLPRVGPRMLIVLGALVAAGEMLLLQWLAVEGSYLSGLSMRRIADMYPGTAKTDEKDAFIIDDATRTKPHTLRSIQISDEGEATSGMPTGFSLNLAGS